MTYEEAKDELNKEILKSYRNLSFAILKGAIDDMRTKQKPSNTEERNREIAKNKASAERFINGTSKRWFEELCIFVDFDARAIRQRLNKTERNKQKKLSWEELICHYQEKLKNGKTS